MQQPKQGRASTAEHDAHYKSTLCCRCQLRAWDTHVGSERLAPYARGAGIPNRLRSHLCEYYPGALQAFHVAGTLALDSKHARAVLTAAPTPASAARSPAGA
jgi:hypothetical protein